MQSTATGDVDGGIGGSEILPLLGLGPDAFGARTPPQPHRAAQTRGFAGGARRDADGAACTHGACTWMT